ncbi:MAG: hypothetical protein ACFFBD_13740, partial [Candidatus Hodarchaeota archaeon]
CGVGVFICGSMPIEPEVRKVDSKGRIVLPLKEQKEVYLIKKDEVLFISKDIHSLKAILKKLDVLKNMNKIRVIEEWFNLLSEAKLTELSSQQINDNITMNLSSKHLKMLEELDFEKFNQY